MCPPPPSSPAARRWVKGLVKAEVSLCGVLRGLPHHKKVETEAQPTNNRKQGMMRGLVGRRPGGVGAQRQAWGMSWSSPAGPLTAEPCSARDRRAGPQGPHQAPGLRLHGDGMLHAPHKLNTLQRSPVAAATPPQCHASAPNSLFGPAHRLTRCSSWPQASCTFQPASYEVSCAEVACVQLPRETLPLPCLPAGLRVGACPLAALRVATVPLCATKTPLCALLCPPGALCHLGVVCTVETEVKQLPSCTFTIRVAP